MSATILEGPAVAEAISEDVMNRVTALAAQGVTPCLGILRVGERPDDLSRTSVAHASAPRSRALP